MNTEKVWHPFRTVGALYLRQEADMAKHKSASKKTKTFMTAIRKSTERGHAKHGLAGQLPHLSFADYYDPHLWAFRSLRR